MKTLVNIEKRYNQLNSLIIISQLKSCYSNICKPAPPFLNSPVHVTKDKCPPSKTLSLKASPSGKILHESSMTSPHIHVTNLDHITNPDHMTNPEHIPGSEECPWRIIALSGERIKLKVAIFIINAYIYM